MVTPPLVSVIIPCYNAEKWLVEAVDSCIQQTYRPLEVIIIDDGSKDGSLEIIRQYAAQYPDLIRYETGPNRGGAGARNRGYALSQGRHILFMDADDLLEPETVAGQVEKVIGRTDIIAACPWWNLVWKGNEWIKVYSRSISRHDPLVAELRYGDYLPAPSLLWTREILDDLGGWDESLAANEDGDLRLRAVLKGYEIIRSERGGFTYRHHAAVRVSNTLSQRHLESRIRVLEKAEAELESTGRLNRYQFDLACAYHSLAAATMSYDEAFADRALRRAFQLGGIRSVYGTLKHRLLCYTIGLKRKERLARWLAKTRFSTILGRTRV